MKPTKEQLDIINETSHCVVIAKPGSGKTYTLSQKIKRILPNLNDYQGVIAISYTNKASDELKERSVEGGLQIKGSFFGTIDKFYISEIILPFGSHVFGRTDNDVEIHSGNEEEAINKKDDKRIQKLLDIGYENLEFKHINWLKKQYIKGIVYLELVGLIALYICENSVACRRYLRARYTHIIIDEYQDSGVEQHMMFLKIKSLGICAIAVGDGDQSIFGFAEKDSRHLLELAQDSKNGFEVYTLNKNHRCHNSIVNYSIAFLNKEFNAIAFDEPRIFEKRIIGTQVEISKWINNDLDKIKNKFNIIDNKGIAILVRGDVTGKIIDNYLDIKHKYFKNTPLDVDSNLWSQLFRELLYIIYDKNSNKYEMIKKYIDINVDKRNAKYVLVELQGISTHLLENPYEIEEYTEKIIEIVKILLPNGENAKSLQLFNQVVTTPEYLNSYLPAKKDEVQIMTLHKSKGLEFDVVIHLDLYNYIIPNPYNKDITQDMNLHYVGITRAKQALYLISSTQRFNKNGECKPGIKSDFLNKTYLRNLRIDV
ncbi:UvrD-helicase domain-containing protein [Bacillus mycoides]|uniref:UvrD-helicase domain-containing protein n=1 Tax=Bacillus mycoides TaxID=1405 RepID=UPI003D652FCB